MLANLDKKLDEKCDICGKRLTQFGSKRLKDGWCCRNCAMISSAWLSDADYEEKTISQMKKHLDYRKENYKLLKELKLNHVVNSKYSLYIDQDEEYFLFSKKKNLEIENPDVLKIKDILEISITEESYLGDDEDGVDLYFNIKLDAGEIRNVRFRINEFPNIEIEGEDYNKALNLADAYIDALNNQELE